MATTKDSYEYIAQKISAMKETYSSLRDKADNYVFSALCIKSNFYKNPALILNEKDFKTYIVDGQYDGGVDVLLSDPSSEGSDLVIGQSKYYKRISYDDALNALLKMALFYKDMLNGHYEQVNETVQRSFLSLNSEIGEESKIHFVLYTSAPQSGISKDRLTKKFMEQFVNVSNIEVSILFGSDIEDEIKESESRRPTVETGKISIDQPNNYLEYEDNAAIVNVSAFSIKQLYAQHFTNLLSRNLRYHIAGRDIDKAIEESINSNPDSFWFKNNGITIICDDFSIDGKEVKLKNFSIVNGGQTTYMIHKNKTISSMNDLFLPCKIIKTFGETEEEKTKFSLEIAKATNSQKAIKPVDLKANSPEQVRFSQAMREVGVFYQTKRGEEVPKLYKERYLNTDLLEVGKLCLCAIFQLPCASRSKPSTMYNEKYYNPIFNENQSQVAKICKELLYIDNYFRTVFQSKFDKENAKQPNSSERISFAHNARTICIAFSAFACRYIQGNITDDDLREIFNTTKSDNYSDISYDIFRKLGNVQSLLQQFISDNKDDYETVLDKLFNIIINAGITSYAMANKYDATLTASNFLKKDQNYCDILQMQWSSIQRQIKDVFDNTKDKVKV